MSWQRLAAFEGGTVTALAAAPQPSAVVFAATLTGVFRSDDGGDSWAWAGRGLVSPFVQDVAVSPHYERDGFAAAATTVSGLHLSSSRGAVWTRQDFWGVRPTVTRVAVSPSFAADQTIVAGTQGEGIYVSRNAGRSWSGFVRGIDGVEISALAVSPQGARGAAILAATDAGGMLRSTDAGRTWEAAADPLDDPVECCAWVDADTVVAGTAGGRLLQSRDAGRSWATVRRGGGAVNGIAVAASTVFAVTGAGLLWTSRDAGASWTDERIAPAAGVAALCVAAVGDRVLVGADGLGVFQRTGGGGFRPANTGFVSRPLLDLAASPSFADDQTLMLGTLSDGVLVSRDGGATWSPGRGGLRGAPVSTVRPAPGFSTSGAAAAIAGGELHWTDDAGETWETRAGAALDGAATALEFSPEFVDDGIVGVGGADGRVRVSPDRGRTWRAAGAGLPPGAVLTMAFSPGFGADRTLLAAVGGAAGVVVAQSTDGGASWAPWVADEEPSGWASLALPANFRPRRGPVVLAVGGRVLMPPDTERGAWSALQLGRGGLAVRQAAASPSFTRDGLLAAATSEGVYLSCDHGRVWESSGSPFAGQAVERVLMLQHPDLGHVLYAALARGEIWRFASNGG